MMITKLVSCPKIRPNRYVPFLKEMEYLRKRGDTFHFKIDGNNLQITVDLDEANANGEGEFQFCAQALQEALPFIEHKPFFQVEYAYVEKHDALNKPEVFNISQFRVFQNGMIQRQMAKDVNLWTEEEGW